MVFIDASFTNNANNTLQISFIIAIADNSSSMNIVYWSSIKCKRVTRSVLASKLYAIAHRFNHGAVLKSTIEKILQVELPLILYIDSKSLYKYLIKLGSTQEKRLMVNLIYLRQLYKRRIITEIKWINGDLNPIDAIIKANACNALRNLINTNIINLNTKEWVERG